jgi:long-chain acyl-CoA synthetase
MEILMTLKDLLNRAASESGDRVAIRFKHGKQWRTYSYRELRTRVQHVAEMCVDFGVKPGDRVALWRENAPDWQEIYLGIVSVGGIAVPVDAKLQPQEVLHILHDSGAKVLFTAARNYSVLSDIEARLPALKSVVLIGGHSLLPVESAHIEYFDYQERLKFVHIRATSKKRAYDRIGPEPGDLASLIYTSGTTGRQKGAMLTHQNFVSNVESCLDAIAVTSADNFLVLLPLHHSFAFTTTMVIPLYVQCGVSMVENLKTIAQNMAETKPTVMLAVPLLLEKMLVRILEGVDKKTVARFMYHHGLARLVGRGVRKKLGGSLRLIISGGAPADPDVLHGWNRLGMKLVEGYGITETSPVISLNPLNKPRIGTVGKVLPNVEVRIDAPDESGSGEIVVSGPSIMQGYYNNPEATANCLKDGWFYSGDLGYFDKRGYLVINGRQKNLIVNKEGKNIYPEEVEIQMNHSPYILESLCMGYCDEGSVGERVGLIAVPDFGHFDEEAAERGKPFSDEEIRLKVVESVKDQCAHLSGYKRPRCIQVSFEEFQKTSTQKVKRYLYAIDTSKGLEE